MFKLSFYHQRVRCQFTVNANESATYALRHHTDSKYVSFGVDCKRQSLSVTNELTHGFTHTDTQLLYYSRRMKLKHTPSVHWHCSLDDMKVIWAALTYSALQWIAAALHNLTGNCSTSLKCFKVSLQAGVAFEDGRPQQIFVIMSATLSPNSSSSIDNRNLNIFRYKLNLFTKLVYKHIGAALQSVK